MIKDAYADPVNGEHNKAAINNNVPRVTKEPAAVNVKSSTKATPITSASPVPTAKVQEAQKPTKNSVAPAKAPAIVSVQPPAKAAPTTPTSSIATDKVQEAQKTTKAPLADANAPTVVESTQVAAQPSQKAAPIFSSALPHVEQRVPEKTTGEDSAQKSTPKLADKSLTQSNAHIKDNIGAKSKLDASKSNLQSKSSNTQIDSQSKNSLKNRSAGALSPYATSTRKSNSQLNSQVINKSNAALAEENTTSNLKLAAKSTSQINKSAMRVGEESPETLKQSNLKLAARSNHSISAPETTLAAQSNRSLPNSRNKLPSTAELVIEEQEANAISETSNQASQDARAELEVLQEANPAESQHIASTEQEPNDQAASANATSTHISNSQLNNQGVNISNAVLAEEHTTSNLKLPATSTSEVSKSLMGVSEESKQAEPVEIQASEQDSSDPSNDQQNQQTYDADQVATDVVETSMAVESAPEVSEIDNSAQPDAGAGEQVSVAPQINEIVQNQDNDVVAPPEMQPADAQSQPNVVETEISEPVSMEVEQVTDTEYPAAELELVAITD